MGKCAFASANRCFILLNPLRSVSTSEATDLHYTDLHYKDNRRKRTPRSLASRVMTRVS
jgi:hypothetical protein